MEQPKPLLTTPVAVIIGSIIIGLAIMISNGTLKLNNNVQGAKIVAPTAAPNVTQQKTTVTLDQIKDIFNKSLVKFGNSNSKLVILEISDPSCPYCQAAAGKNPELNKQIGAKFTLVSDGGSYVAPVPEIKKLVEQGKTAFAFLYYPGHGNGEMGTKALYCAFENNKYWEVHDMVMSAAGYDLLNNTVKNDKTASQQLANFLKPAFDPTVMKSCLDSGKYDSRLQEDMSLGTSLNIGGTPGFYLNATLFAGAYNYKDMESTVLSTLK